MLNDLKGRTSVTESFWKSDLMALFFPKSGSLVVHHSRATSTPLPLLFALFSLFPLRGSGYFKLNQATRQKVQIYDSDKMSSSKVRLVSFCLHERAVEKRSEHFKAFLKIIFIFDFSWCVCSGCWTSCFANEQALHSIHNFTAGTRGSLLWMYPPPPSTHHRWRFQSGRDGLSTHAGHW